MLTDMLAVRFGADQAHFAKPLKMRPSSDSCAEPLFGRDVELRAFPVPDKRYPRWTADRREAEQLSGRARDEVAKLTLGFATR